MESEAISRTSSVENQTLSPLGTIIQHNSHGYQFNQLFNFVNLIDHVYLAAGQSESIIVAFLPQEKLYDPSSHDKHNPFHTNEEEESNDFFEVNGVIFFFAFKLPSPQPDNQSVINDLIAEISNNETAPPDYQVLNNLIF